MVDERYYTQQEIADRFRVKRNVVKGLVKHYRKARISIDKKRQKEELYRQQLTAVDLAVSE